MLITDVKTHLAREWRTFLFVTVHTDEGIYGLGESGITSRELGVAGMIEHLKPLLVGQDPFRIEHIWQMMWRGGFYPSGQILAAAIAAIDIALWDIKGKALNQPVYQLLGGRSRDRVLTYCHVHGRDPKALREEVLERCEAGWKCLRWEPQETSPGVLDSRLALKVAVERGGILREAAGEAAELCFDAHTKFGVSDAVRLCRELEPLRPFFVEDPIRSEQPSQYRRLREQVAVPLAAGEQYAHKWQFREVIEDELIDFARLDVCIAGGLTEGRKVAALCETHFVDLAVHNPIGPVSTAACLHLNLAMPNVAVQELPKRPGESLSELVTGQPEWIDGYLYPPSKPGLGLEFEPKALAKYEFRMEELPHLQKPDGSFTNW